MKTRRVSIILFYDERGNILFQDRRSMSKNGEEFGFFGGRIEDRETPKQAITREIKEELGINLDNFTHFKSYKEYISEIDTELERNVFLAKMPDLKKIKCEEGKPVKIKFEDSFNLKTTPGDSKLLKEIFEYLKKTQK